MQESFFNAVRKRAAKYASVSDAIWDFAELGFMESRSSALLCQVLKDEGFKVTQGVCGMPTAFTAEWSQGTGGPLIGFLAEYDALPALSQKDGAISHLPLVANGPGHGCGHNAMGPMQALTVSSLKECLEQTHIPATLIVFGTPAEELLAGKGFMVRDGLFDNLDAVIDCHSSSMFGTFYGIQNNALFSFLVRFQGRTAHAGSRPWEGRSAADAVELMHAGTERLREHMLPEQRIHWATRNSPAAPNVVPDRCETWYYIRSQDPFIQDLYERVRNCARGAALMTGTVETVRFLAACHQRYANRHLACALYANMQKIGYPEYSDEEQHFARALQHALGAPEEGLAPPMTCIDAEAAPFKGSSSDVGDVTLKAPTATLLFPTWVPCAKEHTWPVTACQRSSIAHKGIKAGAEVSGLTVLDLLTKKDLLQAVKDEFEETAAKHPFIPYLPEDAMPPLEWHREEMDAVRPLLEKALAELTRQDNEIKPA